MAQALKAHTSALAIVPPASVWKQMQLVRCRHDKSFVRWPPHMNLLYPFAPADTPAFEQACQAITSALANTQPFRITLSQFNSFRHSARSFTLWLDPCSTELVQLQSALYSALPQYNDLNEDATRGTTQFTPHLSLGQFKSAVDLESVQQAVNSTWQPISFQVEEVVVLTRKDYLEPFCIERVIPLGGGSSSSSSSSETYHALSQSGLLGVRVPYLATAGPAAALPQPLALDPAACEAAARPASAPSSNAQPSAELACAHDTLHARFGLGGAVLDAAWALHIPHLQPSQPPLSQAGHLDAAAAAHEPPTALAGCYFAYGQHMDVTQLHGLGVMPIWMLPAVLLGARLVFNHMGGEPNLAAAGDPAGTAAAATALQLDPAGCTAGSAEPSSTSPSSTTSGSTDPARAMTTRDTSQTHAGHVHGVLMGLDLRGLSRLLLSQHERVPVEVRVRPYISSTGGVSGIGGPSSLTGSASVTDESAGGGSVWALTFISPRERVIRELPPPERSITRVAAAARASHLDPAYCTWLEPLPCHTKPHNPTQRSSHEAATAQAGSAADLAPEGVTGAAGALPAAYWTSAYDGRRLQEWPNLRTGADQVLGGNTARRRGRKRTG